MVIWDDAPEEVTPPPVYIPTPVVTKPKGPIDVFDEECSRG